FGSLFSPEDGGLGSYDTIYPERGLWGCNPPYIEDIYQGSVAHCIDVLDRAPGPLYITYTFVDWKDMDHKALRESKYFVGMQKFGFKYYDALNRRTIQSKGHGSVQFLLKKEAQTEAEAEAESESKVETEAKEESEREAEAETKVETEAEGEGEAVETAVAVEPVEGESPKEQKETVEEAEKAESPEVAEETVESGEGPVSEKAEAVGEEGETASSPEAPPAKRVAE
ncbi:hypothetical protein KIPB_010438, partial [Kipferlia bialata]